ncbi:MAG: hypothetical protein R3E53_06560 [Myxococcota bacterium]
MLYATGGCTCHTNYPGEGEAAPALAGGRGLETPFGVFYSTNLTPDRETGLAAGARRTSRDARGLSARRSALLPRLSVHGVLGPRGRGPARSLGLSAILPAVKRENRPPDAPFPFSWRATLAGWK